MREKSPKKVKIPDKIKVEENIKEEELKSEAVDNEKINEEDADPETVEEEEPVTEESHSTKKISSYVGDLLSRVVSMGEGGIKKAADLKLPKEVILYGKEQIGSFRTDITRIFGTEIKTFLGSINIGKELVKMLTMLSFEVKMQIRLVPNDRGGVDFKPVTEVKISEKNEEK
jgi:hypothetical protein